MTPLTSPTTRSCILKALTSPAKFVERLERKKRCRKNTVVEVTTLLSMDISRDSISMALVTPPSSTSSRSNNQQQQQNHHRIRRPSPRSSYSFLELPSIPVPAGKSLHHDTLPLQVIRDVAYAYNVQGFVVGWPLQKDTGKMGYQCGRVWHTLEALQRMNDNRQFFTHQRPICLWDPWQTTLESQRMDEFGRCAEFARTSKETEYAASKERYHMGSTEVVSSPNSDESSAVSLWKDFCRVQWPTAIASSEWLGYGLPGRPMEQPTTSSCMLSTPKKVSKCLFVDRQLKTALAAATVAAA